MLRPENSHSYHVAMERGREDTAVEVGGASSERPSGRGWRRVALYALAGVFLAIVVWRSEIWNADETLRDVDPVLAALVPLASLAMVPPLALRGREALIVLGHRFSALSLAPITYYGNMAGFLTPASSGEILRPALFERAFGLPLAKGAAAVLYERIFSMYIMCLTGLAALAATGILPAPLALGAILGLAVLPALPYLLLTTLNIRFSSIKARLPIFLQARIGRLDEAADALDTLWRSPRLVVSFTLLSLLVFGAMMLQFWLVVEATGEHISLAQAWVALFTASLVGVASGLPLGLGATDATLISILSAYDVDVTAGAAIALLMRLLMNLPAGILALLMYVVTLRQRAVQPIAAALAATPGLASAGSERR